MKTDGARLHSESRSSAVSGFRKKAAGKVHKTGRCALLNAG